MPLPPPLPRLMIGAYVQPNFPLNAFPHSQYYEYILFLRKDVLLGIYNRISQKQPCNAYTRKCKEHR
jgi:hypothetical protein